MFRIVSIRRVTLLFYAGLLFFSTHCPLRADVYRDGSWMETITTSLATFGRATSRSGFVRRDKIAHFTAYAILTLLAFWAANSYPGIRRRLRDTRVSGGMMIIMLLFAYGFFDEATQPLFGRSFEWFDYAANVAGIGLVSALLAVAVGFRGFCRAARRSRPVVQIP